ncbi:MAG: hypothetical protein AAF288_09845 [Planctomycetota bacterium]
MADVFKPAKRSAAMRAVPRRDTGSTRALRGLGWSVAVVWECSLKPSKREATVRRVARFLGPARA